MSQKPRSSQSSMMPSFMQYYPNLTNIQSSLNTLCSEHDSLMPLLSLLETLPNISKSSHNIKINLKKIDDLQKSLIHQKQIFHLNQNNTDQSNTITQVSNLTNTLKQCQQNIKQLQDILLNSAQSPTQASLPQDFQQLLNTHKHSVQSLLSSSKNNIQLKYKSNHFNINLNQQYQKLLPTSLFSQYQQQILNIYRQIELINLDMNKNSNDILEFHNFSCRRIEYQLYQLKEIIKATIEGNNFEHSQIISSRVQMVYYQIKGLRKKCLIQFNKKAQEGQSINTLLQSIKIDLKRLQQQWNNVNTQLIKFKQIIANKDTFSNSSSRIKHKI